MKSNTKGKERSVHSSVSQSLNTSHIDPNFKDNSASSNEGEETEEEEEEEDEDSEESEDEELLNRLRFKRKNRTIDVTWEYKADMVKLEPEDGKDKDRHKDILKKKTITSRYDFRWLIALGK